VPTFYMEDNYGEHEDDLEGPSIPDNVKAFCKKMIKLNRFTLFAFDAQSLQWRIKEIEFTKGYIGPLPEELRP